jgi:succinyl-diaminopimelate desuccinylase
MVSGADRVARLGSLTGKVFRELEPRKLAELTSSLVKVPSVNPPGDEKELAHFIADWFEKRGFDCTMTEAVPGRPNVEVRLDGNTEPPYKTLVFNGHTDVVPAGSDWIHDPFGGQIEGNRVYGRGAADMKGGLAAMMVTLEALKSEAVNNFRGSIIFHAVADEETGGRRGTYHMVKRGLKANFGIIGEPSDMRICCAHKGNVTFEVTTHGKAAHASQPENGVNAITMMMHILNTLQGYSDRIKSSHKHPLLGWPTVNVGAISGGIKSNVVPDRCWIAAERRVVPPETIESVQYEIESLLKNLKDRVVDLVFDLEFVHSTGASQISGEEEVVRGLLASLCDVTGKTDAQPQGFMATCDAYFMNSVGGIPTAIFGPGHLKDIHSPDEYVDVSELEVCAKIYALTALRLVT